MITASLLKNNSIYILVECNVRSSTHSVVRLAEISQYNEI